MVIKKFLLATVGCEITFSATDSRSSPERSISRVGTVSRVAMRCILGGLPSSTDKGRSTGFACVDCSSTNKRSSSVATPTTAKGQRSRSQIASNCARDCGAIANTYRSCDSLHQISAGDMPDSSSGTLRRSNCPPFSAPCTSSGNAFDKPPAPTSWIDRIGLVSPMATHASITSCARRCISGLPRCTESKSKASWLAPV